MKISRFLKLCLPKTCCCCIDLRIGASILSAIGIIMELHVFNANISLLAICTFGFSLKLDPASSAALANANLTIEAGEQMLLCENLFVLVSSAIVAFVSGVFYLAVTVPVLACDTLQLLGFLHVSSMPPTSYIYILYMHKLRWKSVTFP